MGPRIPLFWTTGDVCPGVQSQGGSPRVRASSPVRNGFLRRKQFLPSANEVVERSVGHSVHRGRCVSQHAVGQIPLQADTPLPSACQDTRLPPAATAADGTHPTGMHSCFAFHFLQCEPVFRLHKSNFLSSNIQPHHILHLGFIRHNLITRGLISTVSGSR